MSEISKSIIHIGGLVRSLNDLGPIKVLKFKNSQSLNLIGYQWLVEDAKAIAIYIHGATTEKLNSNKISVCAYDLQGHGLSEAWRNSKANVEVFDDFAFDTLHYAYLVNKLFNNEKDLPIFIIGISMGGGIVLRALELLNMININKKIPFRFMQPLFCNGKLKLPRTQILDVSMYEQISIKGCVSLCPNLSLKKVLNSPSNRLLKSVAPVISYYYPTLLAATLLRNPNLQSINEDRSADKHGIYVKKLPSRFAYENLAAGPLIMSDSNYLTIANNKVSILLIHSRLDTMTDPEGSIELYEKIKNQSTDVNILLLDSMWHHLILEPGFDKVIQHFIDWALFRMDNQWQVKQAKKI